MIRNSAAGFDPEKFHEGGKNEVTHALKKLGLRLAVMLGTTWGDAKRLGSHDRDVTQAHYVPLDPATIHKQAGFADPGMNFRVHHFLGRAAVTAEREAWTELKELVIPGLDEFVAVLPKSLLAAGRALDGLRDVLLQDMALQISNPVYAQYYEAHVPNFQPIVSHRAWSSFATEIAKAHNESLHRKDELVEAFARPHLSRQADIEAAVKAALKSVQEVQTIYAAPGLASDLTQQAVSEPSTERPATSTTKPGDAAVKPAKQLKTFNLAGLHSVKAAWQAYLAVETTPREERKWANHPSETAFSRFKKGLAAEIAARTVSQSLDAALDSLEQELVSFPSTKQYTSLQKLASFYTHDSKQKRSGRADASELNKRQCT